MEQSKKMSNSTKILAIFSVILILLLVGFLILKPTLTVFSVGPSEDANGSDQVSGGNIIETKQKQAPAETPTPESPETTEPQATEGGIIATAEKQPVQQEVLISEENKTKLPAPIISVQWADNGSLTQYVDACGTLSTVGATYTLNQSVSSSGTCFNITANNVVINCNGFTITSGSSGYGIDARNTTAGASAFTGLQALKCNINGSSTSIYAIAHPFFFLLLHKVPVEA